MDFLQNVVSPQKEMSAYETLWAIEGIKETKLKELFRDYIPSEALKRVSEHKQKELFLAEQAFEKTQDKVNKFLKDSLNQKRLGFSIVVNNGFQYPKNLRTDYPTGLFYYKGDLGILEERCISIVGSRKVSTDGILKTKELATKLSDENFVIVSGLARGVDTIAHQSAIENNGLTIGVIGTPIDKYYPMENKLLQDKIAKDFLLISQVPFYKYAHESFKHRTYHFPRRNMTMASISEATVIVEASDTSGSLVQARACLKQNKKLFILDSCFKNEKVKWPTFYEKRGAIRVKNVLDILGKLNEKMV